MNKVRLGIGTVQFGVNYGISNTTGQTSLDEVSKILTLALENNIKLLDTASAYGESEKMLGNFDLSKFKVVSKFIPPEKEDFIEKQLQQSLTNLKIDTLYGYMAHRVSDVIENPIRWEEMIKLKESGLIKKVGFSFNTPDEVEKILELDMRPDLVQIPYNYFDQRFEKQIAIFNSMGCEVHTRSAFLQGLFFLSKEKLMPKFAQVAPIILSMQMKYKHNLAGALLNYCLSNPCIDHVIIGLNDSKQFIDNLKSMNNAESLQKIDVKIPDYITTPSRWNN